MYDLRLTWAKLSGGPLLDAEHPVALCTREVRLHLRDSSAAPCASAAGMGTVLLCLHEQCCFYLLRSSTDRRQRRVQRLPGSGARMELVHHRPRLICA